MVDRRFVWCPAIARDPVDFVVRDDEESIWDQCSEGHEAVPRGDANLISSAAKGPVDLGIHFPLFDLDYEVRLVPSRTPGHYHLHLDKPVVWEKYVKVLDAMVEAGLLQKGWVDAAKASGEALLRLPKEET